MRRLNSQLTVVGSHHGYYRPADEDTLVAGIRAAEPDFLWVGLGTPKQQEWIARHRTALGPVTILAVGFAFDVNAGTKRDAPLWMQRTGLTWVYRMGSEPRRLLARYFRWNSLFLFYLAVDFLKRRRVNA
jgi:N-acetylglucosaminyldiphosphoundecaprenol N-acetyl-beta-D-mannosaminyltransferase